MTEDEEFINNYVLTEDTMEEYKTVVEGGSGSVMRDVLLLSGSLAAVAGASDVGASSLTAVAAQAASCGCPGWQLWLPHWWLRWPPH